VAVGCAIDRKVELNSLCRTVRKTVRRDVPGAAGEFRPRRRTLSDPTLNGATGATIADGQAVVTILDDEPRISIYDVSALEGDSGTTLFTFTVSLSASYDQAVTVNYATADGTATAPDHDYVAASGTLRFAPGEETKTITIQVIGDTTDVLDETFFVNLGGASTNALIVNRHGIGNIHDDDLPSQPGDPNPDPGDNPYGNFYV
jgi:Calx-beta domain